MNLWQTIEELQNMLEIERKCRAHFEAQAARVWSQHKQLEKKIHGQRAVIRSLTEQLAKAQ